jgi:hypothetical protein
MDFVSKIQLTESDPIYALTVNVLMREISIQSAGKKEERGEMRIEGQGDYTTGCIYREKNKRKKS